MTEEQIRIQLNSYRDAIRDIRAAVRQIEELGLRATASGSIAPKQDRVVASLPLQARFENAIADKADLERIVMEELARLEDDRKKAEALISLAPSTVARIVLTRFYIEGRTNNEVARSMHYDVRSVQKIKHKAIRRIADKWA